MKNVFRKGLFTARTPAKKLARRRWWLRFRRRYAWLIALVAGLIGWFIDSLLAQLGPWEIWLRAIVLMLAVMASKRRGKPIQF